MEARQTALITGSTRGFGSCLAQIHAQRGGNLILVGRSEVRLDAQKKELEDAYGVRVQTMLQRVHDQGLPYRCEDVPWQPAG